MANSRCGNGLELEHEVPTTGDKQGAAVLNRFGLALKAALCRPEIREAVKQATEDGSEPAHTFDHEHHSQ
jgi:hypothetical protein